MLNMSNSFISLNLENLNLGNRTKAAKALLKKTSETGVGPFAYWKIKLGARAKAAAALIEAQSEIEITELQQRTAWRLLAEEAQYQKNMEGITAKAVPQLNENADPASMDNDWMVNFFDKSRIVSDDQMQNLWSRVLAGEANTPGIYAKRTVNFLSDLDKSEADLFTKLCGFVVRIGIPVPLVFDDKAKIYNKHGINFMSLQHLESIGLIKFKSFEGFIQERVPKKFSLAYDGRTFAFEMPKDTNNTLEIGKTLLTRTGTELFPICGAKPVDGFWEYVKDKWNDYLPKSETE